MRHELSEEGLQEGPGSLATRQGSWSSEELLDTELQNTPLLWPHSGTAGEDMQQDKVRQMLTSHERATVTMHKAFLEYAKGGLLL